MKREIKRQRMDRKIVEYLRLGKSANQISRQLRVSKKRIRRVRNSAEREGYLQPEVRLPSYPEQLFAKQQQPPATEVSEVDTLLGNYKNWITERLKLGWYPVTVFEELPIEVSRSSFYRFLNRHDLVQCGRRARVVPEIVNDPGEVLQVDWGKLRTVTIGTKSRTLWIFSGVLGYSRYRMVRLVWTNDVKTTLEVLHILEQGNGFVDYRKVWGILSLDKKYSPEDIERACQRAVSMEHYSYTSVRKLLRLQVKPGSSATASANPCAKHHRFVRPIGEYQRHVQLALIKGGKANERRNHQRAAS